MKKTILHHVTLSALIILALNSSLFGAQRSQMLTPCCCLTGIVLAIAALVGTSTPTTEVICTQGYGFDAPHGWRDAELQGAGAQFFDDSRGWRRGSPYLHEKEQCKRILAAAQGKKSQ